MQFALWVATCLSLNFSEGPHSRILVISGSGLARQFGLIVRFFPFSETTPLRKTSGTLLFIGPRQQVALATYAFVTLRRQLIRDRKAAHAKLKMGRVASDAWARYWVSAVAQKIAALALPFSSGLANTYVAQHYGSHGTTKMRGTKIDFSDAEVQKAAADARASGRDAQLFAAMAEAGNMPALPGQV